MVSNVSEMDSTKSFTLKMMLSVITSFSSPSEVGSTDSVGSPLSMLLMAIEEVA
jgi:hypothetical protein